MKNDIIEITLKEPIKIAVNGEFEEATIISMKAPTYNDKKYTRKLKQLCMRALQYVGMQSVRSLSKEQLKALETEQDESQIPKTPEEIKQSLYAQIPASNVDYDLFLETFGEFMSKQKNITLNTVPFTKTMVKELSDDVLEDICFTYIANFIKVSL